MERRLAAILAADVAGYSRLMEADEEGTLARLNEYRQVTDRLVADHRGRVFGSAGDSVIAEFASPVEAVRCAIAIQQEIERRNGKLPQNHRMRFRIGVNLGDVMADRDSLFGDGVNVAARLEELAEPGEIRISAKVHDEVAGKTDGSFADAGEHHVKNIARPIRVWRWSAEAIVRPPASSASLELPDQPSIAVLPFTNMSGDREQDYLADGLTEDIITGLSRVGSLFVIARNSTFTYKGHAVDVKQAARELGVRYILEGSVRKSGLRVRTTAQLVDASTGHHVWAEKFDQEIADIFDLQDEITRNVVASIQTQILLAEGSSARRPSRIDLSIWELVSRAMARIHDLTHESLADARQLAERALKIDPSCGPAWRCLSIATYHQAHMLAAADYEGTLSQALEAAERSVRLDTNDEFAHWNLGNVLVARRHHDRAIAALERSIEINPNFSAAHGSLGTALCYAGRPGEGVAKNELAIRADPRNPSIFFRYSGLALGNYLIGDYERAANWARKSLQRNPGWYLGYVYLVAALAQLGRTEEAESVRGEYLRLFSHATISELQRLPFKLTSDFERLCEGLRKAGLPE